MLLKKVALGILTLIFLAGCAKDANTNCNYNECATVAPADEIQRIKNYLSTINVTNAQQHCSGVFYVITNQGDGIKPNACGQINAGYEGKFIDGRTFDKSTGASFSLSGVIPGWTNTIPLIKEHGKITIYIPPTLGYGKTDIINPQTGAVSFPGDSILVFDVTLNTVY